MNLRPNLYQAFLDLVERRPLWGATSLYAVVGTVVFFVVAVKRWAFGEPVTARIVVIDFVAYSATAAIIFIGCCWVQTSSRRTFERLMQGAGDSPRKEIK